MSKCTNRHITRPGGRARGPDFGGPWTPSPCSRTTTRPSRSCSSGSRRPATRPTSRSARSSTGSSRSCRCTPPIEEQLFYPVTRATVPDTEDIVLESLEEHHVVKWLLVRAREDGPGRRALRRQGHRAHRERPPPRRGGGDRVLPEGARRARAQRPRRPRRRHGRSREVAPTHPHPRSPETPPLNAVTGVVAGAVDKVGDTVRAWPRDRSRWPGAWSAWCPASAASARRPSGRPGPARRRPTSVTPPTTWSMYATAAGRGRPHRRNRRPWRLDDGSDCRLRSGAGAGLSQGARRPVPRRSELRRHGSRRPEGTSSTKRAAGGAELARRRMQLRS